MELIRKNFRFSTIVNIDDIIGNSSLLLMSNEDIDNDPNVKGVVLGERQEMLALQKIWEYEGTPQRYCYVQKRIDIGGDGITKAITIEKIIIDNTLISTSLLIYIFAILLQQEDNGIAANRIRVPVRIDSRFHDNIDNVACHIGVYLKSLFDNFTSPECSNYTINF